MQPDSIIVHISNWQETGIDYIPWIALFLSLAAIIWQIVSWRKDRSVRLQILQLGTDNTNIAVDEHVIILEIAIINIGRQATSITGYDIKMPGIKDNFDFYPDPEDNDKNYNYYILKDGLRYERDLLVNHRKYEKGMIHPGETISGLLCARTFGRIKPNKENYSYLTLIISDHKGNVHKRRLKYSTYHISKNKE